MSPAVLRCNLSVSFRDLFFLSAIVAHKIRYLSRIRFILKVFLKKKQKNETRQTCAVSGFNWRYSHKRKLDEGDVHTCFRARVFFDFIRLRDSSVP